MAKSSEVERRESTNGELSVDTRPDPFKTVVLNAIYEKATDIHVNRIDEGVMVFYRVDGIIHEKRLLSNAEGRQLINQIKTAAGLDAMKSFVPQEGQIKWPDDDVRRDIRVTIVPVGYDAESAHLRILSFPKEAWEIANLGFSESDLEDVSSSISSMGGSS